MGKRENDQLSHCIRYDMILVFRGNNQPVKKYISGNSHELIEHDEHLVTTLK